MGLVAYVLVGTGNTIRNILAYTLTFVFKSLLKRSLDVVAMSVAIAIWLVNMAMAVSLFIAFGVLEFAGFLFVIGLSLAVALIAFPMDSLLKFGVTLNGILWACAPTNLMALPFYVLFGKTGYLAVLDALDKLTGKLSWNVRAGLVGDIFASLGTITKSVPEFSDNIFKNINFNWLTGGKHWVDQTLAKDAYIYISEKPDLPKMIKRITNFEIGLFTAIPSLFAYPVIGAISGIQVSGIIGSIIGYSYGIYKAISLPFRNANKEPIDDLDVLNIVEKDIEQLKTMELKLWEEGPTQPYQGAALAFFSDRKPIMASVHDEVSTPVVSLQ